MNNEKHARLVTLLCPTCGNSSMEEKNDAEGQGIIIHCPSCNRTMSKDELISENGEVIENAIGEMGRGLVKDLEKEFKDILKNAFKYSKNIKIG